MILSMSAQVKLFMFTVGMGFLVGFIYDFFRILRRIVKHSVLICNLEDGLYWIGVSILMFYFMLNENYGEIRLFSILGAFTGMVLYFFTLSSPIIKVSLVIYEFLKKVVTIMVKIIMAPLKLIGGIVKVPFCVLLSFFRKYEPVGKKVLQKPGRYAKIKSRKIKNDLRVILKKV